MKEVALVEDILGERLNCEFSALHTPGGWVGELLGPDGEL